MENKDEKMQKGQKAFAPFAIKCSFAPSTATSDVAPLLGDRAG
jgi:hypothetical protein